MSMMVRASTDAREERSPASVWALHAGSLADWAMSRIVVRTDTFGAYYPNGKQRTAHGLLTRNVIVRHFEGKETIGAHLISTDNECKCVIFDIDAHDRTANPDANLKCARRIVEVLAELKLEGIIFDSNGEGGFHVRAFFKKPVAAPVAWWLRNRIISRLMGEGFAKFEAFPKQEGLTPKTSFGNWVRLPGKHHKRDHWSRIYDLKKDVWLEGESAIERIIAIAGDNPTELIKVYREELKTNPGPKPKTKAKAKTKKKTSQKQPPSHDTNGKKASLEEVRDALQHLPDDWTESYDEWLKAGMGLHDWDSLFGLELWKEFSDRCPEKCDHNACDEKWGSFVQGGGVTIRTIFGAAIDNGWRWAGVNGTGHRPPTTTIEGGREGYPLTDLGNAERLISRYGRRMRYCHPWGRWLVWDGRRWAIDKTGAARRLARKTVRAIYKEAANEPDASRRKEIVKWALVSEKRDRIGSMLYLAEAEEGVPILPEELNSNPWMFNCQNGSIDLKTGELRPHRREDLNTQLCPVDYDPNATCPLWLATLDLFFHREDVRQKQVLINYWQRLCGYALAGVVYDHILPVAYGTGSNGKSTLLGTLLDLFGTDYAMKCPPDLLMVKKHDSHPTDRADLYGKRLVVAIETESGRRLNETMVKELTGGDSIRARRMREDFWEFKPTHKFFMATNYKPVIRGTDNGIWRRLKLIPFTVTMDDKTADKRILERLRSEYPGILACCVRGCLEWQTRGLDEAPEEVAEATGKYRGEQDTIGAFFDECVISHPSLRVRANVLYGRYKAWAESAGEHVVTLKVFGLDIEGRGIHQRRSNGVWYLGIAIRDTPKTDDSDPDMEQSEQSDANFPINRAAAPSKELTGKLVPTVPTVPTCHDKDTTNVIQDSLSLNGGHPTSSLLPVTLSVKTSEDPDQPVRAVRFLAGMLRSGRDLARRYLIEWAVKEGITDSELLDAAECLGVLKTLDDGNETWTLKTINQGTPNE